MGAHLLKNLPALQQVMGMHRAILFAATMLGLTIADSSGKEKKPVAQKHHSLTLEAAISIALRQNPDVLRAIHEIERGGGEGDGRAGRASGLGGQVAGREVVRQRPLGLG